MYKVGVLGAGTWGMAVARVLCNRHHSVMVWSALPQEIEYKTEHIQNYLN